MCETVKKPLSYRLHRLGLCHSQNGTRETGRARFRGSNGKFAITLPLWVCSRMCTHACLLSGSQRTDEFWPSLSTLFEENTPCFPTGQARLADTRADWFPSDLLSLSRACWDYGRQSYCFCLSCGFWRPKLMASSRCSKILAYRAISSGQWPVFLEVSLLVKLDCVGNRAALSVQERKPFCAGRNPRHRGQPTGSHRLDLLPGTQVTQKLTLLLGCFERWAIWQQAENYVKETAFFPLKNRTFLIFLEWLK